MGRREPLPFKAGQPYNRLTLVENLGKSVNGAQLWRAVCDCGNVVEALAANIVRGRTKSCGCLRKELLSAVRYRRVAPVVDLNTRIRVERAHGRDPGDEHTGDVVVGSVVVDKWAGCVDKRVIRRPRFVASPSTLSERSIDDGRQEILRELEDADGNIARAAAALGISRQGLYRRIRRLGLDQMLTIRPYARRAV